MCVCVCVCCTTCFTRCNTHIFDVIFLKAIGATVDFYGNVSLTNNDVEGFDGGAMYMLTFSQMTLNSGAQLEFVNNTGGYDICII